MKKINRFLFIWLLVFSSYAYSRNPFEFADEQLKKYSPIKIEEIYVQKEQNQQKWKITETREKTQIIEDVEGNIRAISLCAKN